MAKLQRTQAIRDAENLRSRKKARNRIYPFPKFERECALLPEEDLFGEIYIAECLVNQKQYCGKTEYCAEHRWFKPKGSHYRAAVRGCDNYFHKALRKYGTPEQFFLDGFKVTVIFHARTKDELNAKEKQVIAERDLMNRDKGYNGKEGGEGGHPSDTVKEELSRASKAWWDSLTEQERADHIELQQAGLKEFFDKMSPEEREQFERDRGKAISAFYDKNPEAREAQSKSQKDFWENMSEEDREARCKAQKEWCEKNPQGLVERSKAQHNYWNRMTEEQRIAERERRLARTRKTWRFNREAAEAAERKKIQDSGFLDFFK